MPGGKTLDGERVETQRLCDESGATKKTQKTNVCRASEKRPHRYRQRLRKVFSLGCFHSLSLRTQQLAVHPAPPTPLFSLQHTPNFFWAHPPPLLLLLLLSCLTCSSFCPVAEELISEQGAGGVDGVLGPPQAHMCSQHLRNALFSSPSVVTSVHKTARCFPLPLRS